MTIKKNRIKEIVKDILWLDTKNLSNLTLPQLEQKMKEEGFHESVIKDLISVLQEKLIKIGEQDFQKWLYHLNFQVPDGLQNEKSAAEFYEKHHFWIEDELVKLEEETKLSWDVQSVDLKKLDVKARKAQLVIRHRLSEIVLELI
ncbi:hypothetical protein [Bacillus marinisedimentorum]|uniref:hypothetical protein n=1 Tax=Bacillus marinisedimentorum TaxID=1821260 RepID=UPI0008721FBE|nr:hypothetical protein [Bacillus marinisedimentorum]